MVGDKAIERGKGEKKKGLVSYGNLLEIFLFLVLEGVTEGFCQGESHGQIYVLISL